MTRTWRLACTDSGDGSPAVAAALVAELRGMAAARGVTVWSVGEWLWASGADDRVREFSAALEGGMGALGASVVDRPGRGES